MNPSLILAAVLALTPAQSSLTLSNVRATYGELGAPRTDGKYLPGDLFFVAFDMDNIKVSEEGKVSYSMGMEVNDKTGKSIFKQDPVKREELLPLGGNKLPARAYLSVGVDQEPGTYTCKVTVTDNATKVTQTLERKFDVVAKDFGLVGLSTSADDKGFVPCATTATVGANLFINFAMVGFGRNKSKQPDATVEVRLTDASGVAALAKPLIIPVPKDLPEKEVLVPFQIPLPLNREGSFIMEIKAKDAVLNKASTLQIPIRILPGGGAAAAPVPH